MHIHRGIYTIINEVDDLQGYPIVQNQIIYHYFGLEKPKTAG